MCSTGPESDNISMVDLRLIEHPLIWLDWFERLLTIRLWALDWEGKESLFTLAWHMARKYCDWNWGNGMYTQGRTFRFQAFSTFYLLQTEQFRNAMVDYLLFLKEYLIDNKLSFKIHNPEKTEVIILIFNLLYFCTLRTSIPPTVDGSTNLQRVQLCPTSLKN